MKIVFLSNYFNHTQKPLSDNLFRLTGGNYVFVETSPLPQERIALGYQSTPEVYKVILDSSTKDDIIKAVNEADVVMCGSAPYELVQHRIKEGKLTFLYSERIFKKKPSIKLFLYYLYYTFKRWGRYNNVYLLGASAYAAQDFNKLFSFKGRTYKWGYFSETIKYGNLDDIYSIKESNRNKRISIVWAARLIELKHPEFAISIAERLKLAGYQFDLNIIGNGILEESLKKLVAEKGLGDCIHLLGAMPPQNVRKYMEHGDIYLFTSDRNEGWGMVVNEAMNSCCAVVASHAVGSVPFLIENNKNGLIYKSGDLDDAFSKVAFLIEHPEERTLIGKEAYKTSTEIWCPERAAQNLITLSEGLLCNKPICNVDGPCSKSFAINDNWM